jgi:hypothetical protein
MSSLALRCEGLQYLVSLKKCQFQAALVGIFKTNQNLVLAVTWLVMAWILTMEAHPIQQ